MQWPIQDSRDHVFSPPSAAAVSADFEVPPGYILLFPSPADLDD